MTVFELIRELTKHDPNAEIVIRRENSSRDMRPLSVVQDRERRGDPLGPPFIFCTWREN